MHDHARFRRGVESKDVRVMMEAFADGAVLHSPITFRPFEGREAVSLLFGVLLDTFLVRSVLVPALTFEIGPGIWLPSGLATRK